MSRMAKNQSEYFKPLRLDQVHHHNRSVEVDGRGIEPSPKRQKRGLEMSDEDFYLPTARLHQTKPLYNERQDDHLSPTLPHLSNRQNF